MAEPTLDSIVDKAFSPIDPLELAREFWPDVYFYKKQREIIYSVEQNKITVVPACNMVGKDFVAGFIALTTFLRYPICRVITTSVSDDHLRVLWAEIYRYIDSCKFKLRRNQGGCLKVNHRDVTKIRNNEECRISYLRGKVSEKGEGLAGHHAPWTLAIIDEACHDAKTEVLTNYGWRLFSSLSGNEQLLTMNPMTRVAEYQHPIALYRSHRKGKMYQCEKRGCSFSVTPNHKMLWQRQKAKCRIKWSNPYLEEISKINGTNRKVPRTFIWQGESVKYFRLSEYRSERKFYPEKQINMEHWLEFLGWYLSEGSIVETSRNHCITITQKNRCILERLAHILSLMGLSPNIYECGECFILRANSAQLSNYLIKFGKYSYQKRIPEFVFKLSSALIQIFLKAYTNGDGYRKDNSYVIYTSSKKMADDLQILIHKTGKQSTVSKRTLTGIAAPNGTSRRDGYVISNPDETSFIKLTYNHIDLVDYDNEVFCAQVPKHHTLFTRRDGVCMWSGNSGVDDIVLTQMETWAKRILIIGNPLPCANFFHRFVEEGDIAAPFDEPIIV